MKVSLGQKILAGFSVSTIVLITVAILSFKNSAKVVSAAKWVKHTQEVLYQLGQITLDCVNIETGERGYIISGKESYLEPYYQARKNMLSHIEQAKVLTRDNPYQQKHITNIDSLSQLFLKRMTYCIEIRRNKGFEEVREVLKSEIGKFLLDRIRTEIRLASLAENHLLEEREAESNAEAHDFNNLFLLLLIIIATVLVSVYIVISINLRALKRSETETANRNWTLAGSEELMKNLQGNKSIKDLAYAIVAHIAVYFDLPAGAVYLIDESRSSLSLAAGYAIDQQDASIQTFEIGQGLIGQVAKENTLKVINDIPDGYFLVDSSLGQLKPKSIALLPFAYEGSVIGVVELASMRGFTALQLDYLRVIQANLAIAIVSGLARRRTADLLEETQHLAEELNAQQEELRQSNDELQQKTTQLEESEQELKAQQEELEMINKELEYKAEMLEEQKDKIENSKVMLETKAREVEQISKYKSEFLANMSHELRTPLNSILILSQLLAENKNNTLAEKEVGFAKNVYNSGNDLLNLINEILDLSKIESGKMELEVEPVKLEDIVQHMGAIFSEMAKNKSLHFKITVNDQLGGSSVKTDKQRVEQILKNLLSNAFKFTPKDGNVTLSIQQAQILPGGKQPQPGTPMLAFAVSDSGIGIPESKKAIIFEAFQQADGSTKRQYGGTGLGLSISRELARALGGEIGLESEEGKGSVFTLYLPVEFDSSLSVSDKEVQISEKKETVYERPAPMPLSSPIGEGLADDDRNDIATGDRVILIIEDDIQFAQVLLDFIRRRNYKGIIAAQGNMGVSYARHYRPDAIMLDLNLPVMDGIEVLKQIKNDPDLRHIPVQIISGADKKMKGFELGAFDFLQKPVSMDDMRKAFDKVEKFISKKLKKLLVVEDNRTQSDAIIELVCSGDIKCSAAYTGAEAYAALEKEELDCIILDLNLPDMSGFELLDKIKSNADFSRVPVIVYTGRDLSREENARLMKLASTVILKTVNSHERLLDETVLFLHNIESKLPKEKQNIIRQLHGTDNVLKNKKVLLVDDDMRNIYSLSNVLEDEGMQCIIAENGKVALNELDKHNDIALVLMDVMMPEMDGYEATMQIRKTPGLQRLPIIALTAKAMKGDREKCLAAGMSDYITKPVNITQLLSLMRVWLYNK